MFERLLNRTVEDVAKDPFSGSFLRYMFDCDRTLAAGNGSCNNVKNKTIRDGKSMETGYATWMSLHYDSVLAIAHGLHNLIRKDCPEAFINKTVLKTCISGRKLYQSIVNSTFTSSNRLGTTTRFHSNGDVEFVGQIEVDDMQNGAYKMSRLNYFEQDKSTIDIMKIDWAKYPKKSNEGQAPISTCTAPCAIGEIQIPHKISCCFQCTPCRENEIVSESEKTCIECDEAKWPDEVKKMCQPIKPTLIKLSDSVSIFSLSTSAGCSAVVFLVFVIFIKNKEKKLLKATSMSVSYCLFVCLIAIFAQVILYQLPASWIVCPIKYCAFHGSYTILYSLLLSKAIRIYRIFRASSKFQKPQYVTDAVLFATASMFCIIQAIVLGAVYITVSFPWPKIIMPNKYEKHVELICEETAEQLFIPASYNISLIMASMLLGYFTRNLPDNFKESMCIFVCSFSTLCVWGCFFPASLFLQTNLQRVLIRLISLLVNGIFCLVCLFIPKCYAALRLTDVQSNVRTFATMDTKTKEPGPDDNDL